MISIPRSMAEQLSLWLNRPPPNKSINFAREEWNFSFILQNPRRAQENNKKNVPKPKKPEIAFASRIFIQSFSSWLVHTFAIDCKQVFCLKLLVLLFLLVFNFSFAALRSVQIYFSLRSSAREGSRNLKFKRKILTRSSRAVTCVSGFRFSTHSQNGQNLSLHEEDNDKRFRWQRKEAENDSKRDKWKVKLLSAGIIDVGWRHSKHAFATYTAALTHPKDLHGEISFKLHQQLSKVISKPSSSKSH